MTPHQADHSQNDNQQEPEPSVKQPKPNHCFICQTKYITCVYIVGIFGALSQLVATAVVIGLFQSGIWTMKDADERYYAEVFSGISITILLCSAISEICLMRAINQRILRYIQWWMFSSVMILAMSCLLTLLSGLTHKALWVTLCFLYLVIRLPAQMYFVDKFVHTENLVVLPHLNNSLYKSIMYRRFS